jgi:iron(III) transport system ATP-binding protein
MTGGPADTALGQPRPARQADSLAAAALDVRGLTKRFGDQVVLSGVSISVAAGSTTAIVGASGSGKTTLLRLVAGFERPDDGSVRLDGRALADAADTTSWVPAHRRHIGYVAQDGALFPHLTVAQNIAFGLDRTGADRRRRGAARVAELLEMVSLEPSLAARRPHEISGGQQQRGALARALARRPRLMLLDESFSALDAGLRVATRRAVGAVLAEAGITTVLVTHDQSEALSFADQVAVMRAGRLAQVGRPTDVYAQPADLETARFLGDAVVLDGWVAGATAHCALGMLPVTSTGHRDGRCRLMVRPEQIHIDDAGTIDATVVGSDFFGPNSTVQLELTTPPGLRAELVGGAERITILHPGPTLPHEGQTVRLRVAGTAVAYPD